MPAYRTVADAHLGSNEFWVKPLDERNEAFAAMRHETKHGDGMCFHEEISVIEGGVRGPGFWSAVTYDDIKEVNRKAELFSSAAGITLGEQPPDTLEFFGSMIVMDNPRHAEFRMLVQKGFTPKTVAAIEESVRVRAKRLVAAAKDKKAAGDETTRNAISWGMQQLTAHPDQRELLRNNFEEMSLTAADEIVRWASPVIHMRRTANEDVEVGNTKIAAGEKVVMWYWSGNRDEDYYPDGHAFDITRPNTKDMEGYGAGGPHFCLGANLARREIQVMYDEIFRQLPDLEITGEPDRLVSGFINGIKRMPCDFSV